MNRKSTRVPAGAGRFRYRTEIRCPPTEPNDISGIRMLRDLLRTLGENTETLLTRGEPPDSIVLRHRDGAWEAIADRIQLEGDSK